MGSCGKTVLVAVEGADCQPLLHWYLSTFHQEDDRVVVVHADDSRQEDKWIMLTSGRAAMSAADTQPSKLFRTTKCCRLQKTCLTTLGEWKVDGTFCCREGSLGEVIVTVAKEEGASLVVMTDRRHGRLWRALVGSSQDYVARHTGLPVMTYSPEQAKKRSSLTCSTDP